MLTATLMLAAAPACVKNPATGERQLVLVPKSQEIALGKQAAEGVAQSIGLVNDPGLQEYVSSMGKALAAKSERPDLPWSFQVVDDPAVNAFALPGGYIFVTRGLMAHLGNDAQLAGVIGHEIGHVTGKHAIDRLSKQQVLQAGLGVGMVVSDTLRGVGQLASAGLGVLFLKYGRDDEYQADDLGVRYATRGGYDVHQMPVVFETLKRVSEASGGGGRLPEWLSTHPDPDNRISRIESKLDGANGTAKGGRADRADYLKQLAGMTYGPDPRQGFFQGDRFFHPEMRFTVAFPQGWKKQNLAQAVVAASPGEDAAIQLTLGKATNPQEALQAFSAQEGVQVQPATTGLVQGLPSATASFVAKTQQGELAGLVTYVSHQNRTFQILTITQAAKLPTYSPAFQQVHASFAQVSDPAVLNVKPAKIELMSVPGRSTLAEFYRSRPATVPIEEIALLNQTTPDATLEAGQTVKWVTGGNLPAKK